jgi:hypothetical protein
VSKNEPAKVLRLPVGLMTCIAKEIRPVNLPLFDQHPCHCHYPNRNHHPSIRPEEESRVWDPPVVDGVFWMAMDKIWTCRVSAPTHAVTLSSSQEPTGMYNRPKMPVPTNYKVLSPTCNNMRVTQYTILQLNEHTCTCMSIISKKNRLVSWY